MIWVSYCGLVCPSRYDARHREPRRCVYALNLGETGISPPDSFSYRSSFRFRSRSRSRSPDKNPLGPRHPTSGDIFYCSGSRQLNHSSWLLAMIFDWAAITKSAGGAKRDNKISITENKRWMNCTLNESFRGAWLWSRNNRYDFGRVELRRAPGRLMNFHFQKRGI